MNTNAKKYNDFTPTNQPNDNASAASNKPAQLNEAPAKDWNNLFTPKPKSEQKQMDPTKATSFVPEGKAPSAKQAEPAEFVDEAIVSMNEEPAMPKFSNKNKKTSNKAGFMGDAGTSDKPKASER